MRSLYAEPYHANDLKEQSDSGPYDRDYESRLVFNQFPQSRRISGASPMPNCSNPHQQPIGMTIAYSNNPANNPPPGVIAA